jgi:hypothetical protein
MSSSIKNIYLLKTSNPSRLLKDLVDKTYQFKKEVTFGNRIELPLNIYITSDIEEIKVDEYYLDTTVNVIFKNDKLFLNGIGYKRIVPTTDDQLIKDGVQAIDDEFLEWFVKNPRCEKVGVINTFDYNKKHFVEHSGYKIIIPKEEPKQDKKMYSEEEVYELLKTYQSNYSYASNEIGLKKWFEQFKKK